MSRVGKPQSPGHLAADQSAVLQLLSEPSTYGRGVSKVERIDTHGAIVFLAADKAYKVKRAVAYPYMDFSTLARRHDACKRELQINRRSAPDLYLHVIPVLAGDSGLLLGTSGDLAAGDVAEWVLVMRRFDQADLLSEKAKAGALTPSLMTDLADAIARFHDAAEERRVRGGGAEAMTWVVRENGEEFAERRDIFDADEAQRLTAGSLAQLARHGDLLDARAEGGKVRHCHGDLHLRNVVLLNGAPTLFDAIEFNDAIACIDVVYDLAFLLMDLDHRGLRSFANLVLNRYLQQRDEFEALPLLPLFLSARAAVRAKVAASLEAVAEDADEKSRRREEALAYFRRAQDYLDPPPAQLVAVGGLSGSGKTTLARELASHIGAAPGALHLRSDVLRKQLAGVSELEHLPEEAYSQESNTAVYEELQRRCRQVLAAGHAVIVDAVFARPDERQTMEALARSAGAGFTGLWLDAQRAVLMARVQGRRGDASDADSRIVAKQLAYDLGAITWQRLPAGRLPSELRDEALACLKKTS